MVTKITSHIMGIYIVSYWSNKLIKTIKSYMRLIPTVYTFFFCSLRVFYVVVALKGYDKSAHAHELTFIHTHNTRIKTPNQAHTHSAANIDSVMFFSFTPLYFLLKHFEFSVYVVFVHLNNMH